MDEAHAEATHVAAFQFMELVGERMAVGGAQGERAGVGRARLGPGGELHEVQHEGRLQARLLERVVGAHVGCAEGDDGEQAESEGAQGGEGEIEYRHGGLRGASPPAGKRRVRSR